MNGLKGKKRNFIAGSQMPWWGTFFLCLFFFVTHLAFGQMVFNYNGDALYNLIAVGAFWDESQYLLFSNILLGYLLKGLYFLVPAVNWYLWILLICNFLSVYALCYLISRRFDGSSSALLTVLTSILLGGDLYQSIEYTETALIAAIAGFSLVGYAVFSGRKHIQIPGLLLLLFGILWRYNCAVMTAPFFGLAFFMHLLMRKHEKEKIPERLRELWKQWRIPGIAILIIFIGAYSAQYVAYHRGPWAEYTEFVYYRTQIIDHAPPWYDPVVHDPIGVTEADTVFFRNWYFADTERMTNETLKALYEAQYQWGQYSLRVGRTILEKTAALILERFGRYPIAAIWLMCFLFAVLSKRRESILQALGTAALVCVDYWYFACIDRAVWRVEIGTWVAGIAVLILFAGRRDPYMAEESPVSGESPSPMRGERGADALILLTAVLVLCLNTAGLVNYFRTEKNHRTAIQYTDQSALFQTLAQKEENFYFGALSTLSIRVYDTPFAENGYRKGLFSNFTYLSGLMMRAPILMDRLAKYGIENPVRALFEQENVYYVGSESDAEFLAEYLRACYSETIYYENADLIGGMGIWKFREAEK